MKPMQKLPLHTSVLTSACCVETFCQESKAETVGWLTAWRRRLISACVGLPD